MAESTWTTEGEVQAAPQVNRLKFALGALIMLGAIAFLIFNGMRGNMQFYVTVDEYFARQEEMATREMRVSGRVLGDTIRFTQIDATNSRLEFEIVDNIYNPGQRLRIVALNEPVPDLLQHEAEALVHGRVGEDGSFYANKGGVLLKCPTRYEEGEQAAAK
jgi:cytochrome c-type biogenesis protein CcmE